MIAVREFLNPKNKLVDEVVRRLLPCARLDPSGAKSLAHILVVVPTAQSARNLRQSLAEAFAPNGVLPPKTEMMSRLLVDESQPVATEAEEIAALAKILSDSNPEDFKNLFPNPPKERGVEWALAMAEMILGVSSILGERALLMREVYPEEDKDRWSDLAKLEDALHSSLVAKGMLSRIESRRLAVSRGCTIDGVEEILLPSAVDVSGALIEYLKNSSQRISVLIHADESEADKFDEWGRPVAMFAAPLSSRDVFPAPTAIVEADEIASLFRSVDSSDALPALAVCDAEMYPELEGAFQNHFSGDELTLRNPSRESFIRSSLGRLLVCMLELAERGDYETFSTFIRTGDVARWAADALKISPAEIAKAVGSLDALQNAHLPRTIDDVVRHAEVDAPNLARMALEVKGALADPFDFLRRIFSTLVLDERESSDRELIAAAKVARDLRDECDSAIVPEYLRRPLYARLLKRATYMLEPTAPHVLATLGWLEIPWCAEDELVIGGFNEGCVPENIVGHPFLPDSLRTRLGLTTNAARAMRDSFIFAEAIRCRATGAVRIHLHQIAGDKSVMKPSRILFEGIGDDELPDLAKRLYAVTKGGSGAPPKSLPDAWRLRLPIPPKGLVWRHKISATVLDSYLRCPFEFFLGETFGEHSDDRLQELDARAFGTLCHEALDEFAKSPVKDSDDERTIGDFLEGAVRRHLSVFGDTLPVVIELQCEAAVARLRAFAAIQATRRKAGWRIVASERSLSCRIKDCPTLITGKVDRIDAHDVTGELAIIDYKTWRRADETKYNSIQLPLYRAMVEASGRFRPDLAKRAKAFYCILAERTEDTLFDEERAYHEGLQAEAESKIVGLLTDLAKGIFYPPTKESNWKTAYDSLVWESPEQGIDSVWLEDQASRREVQE